MQTDFLVIGSGIAGLTYALKIAKHFPDKEVTIITKATPDETNTKYAQGGVAVVNDLENDSFEKHIEDTLIAGDGLCNKEVVEIVITEGPARVQEIIDWGAQFDKNSEGDYKLGREGGHSEFRIIHHKDVTGKEMERALLETIKQTANIKVIHHCFVIDIITQHHTGYLVTKSTPNRSGRRRSVQTSHGRTSRAGVPKRRVQLALLVLLRRLRSARRRSSGVRLPDCR